MHPVDTLKTLKMSKSDASDPKAVVASVAVNKGGSSSAAAVELSDNASAKIPGPGTLYKGNENPVFVNSVLLVLLFDRRFGYSITV